MNYKGKREVREQSQKVANINSQGRKLSRKEDRELTYINKAFDKLTHNFAEVLLGSAWENPAINHLNPFVDFNLFWVNWCDTYNKNKKHLINANELAFHDFAINNTKSNDYDRPIFITGNQLLNLRWAL